MNVISSPSFGFFSLTLYRKMSSRVGELPLSKKSFGFFDGCFAMVASRWLLRDGCFAGSESSCSTSIFVSVKTVSRAQL